MTTYHALQANNATWYYPSLPATLNNQATLTQLPYALRSLLLNHVQHPDEQQTTKMQHVLDWATQGQYGPGSTFTCNHLVLSTERSKAALQGLLSIHAQTDTPQPQQTTVLLEAESSDEQLINLPTPPHVQVSAYKAQPPLIQTETRDGKTYINTPAIAGSTTLNASGIFSPSACAFSAIASLAGLPYPLAATEITGIELHGQLATQLTPEHTATAVCEAVAAQQPQGIVEFFGSGLQHIPLASRHQITQQLSHQGIPCFFPLDTQSLVNNPQADVIQAWAQAQQIWHDSSQSTADYHHQQRLNLTELTHSNPLQQQQQWEICISNPPGSSPKAQQTNLRDCRISGCLDNNRLPVAHTTGPQANILFADSNYGSPTQPDLFAWQHMLIGTTAIVCPAFSDPQRRALAHAGILPLEFQQGDSWQALSLQGDERIELDVPEEMYPFDAVMMVIHRSNGRRELVELTLRLDNAAEIATYKAQGLISHTRQQLLCPAAETACTHHGLNS